MRKFDTSVVPIGRDAALEAGVQVYHGVPCKEGHTVRYVKNRNCVACNTTRSRAYAESHPEHTKQRKADWHASNPGRYAEQDRKRYLERVSDPGKRAELYERQADNRAKNPNTAATYRKAAAKQIAGLTDYYVRSKLMRGTDLEPDDIPESLIALKRTHLELVRYTKESSK